MQNKRIEDKYMKTIIAVMLSGILAHGYMFMNKISFHDDIGWLFGTGTSWSSGRWGLGIISLIMNNTVGKYSIPLQEGIFSLVFIALTACLLIDLLEIKNTFWGMIIGSLMAVFSVVTATFLYMFTAGCYFFALFLAVCAVWLAEKYRYGIVPGIFCIAFSVAIYQAYFSVGVVVAILLLMRKCIDEKGENIFFSLMKYGLLEGGGLVAYLIGVKISLGMTGKHLSNYQGINSMMGISIRSRIKRALYCYVDIWKLITEDVSGLISNYLIRWTIVICIVISVILIVKLGMTISNKWKQIIFYGLGIILPMGINLIYPMTSEETSVTTLMKYSIVFIWIIPIFLLEKLQLEGKDKFKKIIYKIMAVCAVFVIFENAYFSNTVYMKCNFLQEQTTAYYTTLIAQIKMCDGYKDEMPVAYVGMGKIEDKTLATNEGYNINIPLANLDLQDWVNDYGYYDYMRYHCGFMPQLLKEQDIDDDMRKEVDKMPIYPDEGAIKVINDVVVVKFAEME